MKIKLTNMLRGKERNTAQTKEQTRNTEVHLTFVVKLVWKY